MFPCDGNPENRPNLLIIKLNPCDVVVLFNFFQELLQRINLRSGFWGGMMRFFQLYLLPYWDFVPSTSVSGNSEWFLTDFSRQGKKKVLRAQRFLVFSFVRGQVWSRIDSTRWWGKLWMGSIFFVVDKRIEEDDRF